MVADHKLTQAAFLAYAKKGWALRAARATHTNCMQQQNDGRGVTIFPVESATIHFLIATHKSKVQGVGRSHKVPQQRQQKVLHALRRVAWAAVAAAATATAASAVDSAPTSS